jgi:uncharacterized DUF497 family protein
MDEYFELNGIGFLWDRAKARENLRKHGVSFEQASEAFFDPFLRVVDAGTDAEARDAVIGMDTHWNLLFVVHVVFEESGFRIVSARKATRSERLFYEE